MNERVILFTFHEAGSLGADQVYYCELPMPWTLLGIKASGSNANDAKVTVSGGATIARAAIGDSGDPTYLQPAAPAPIDANELVSIALDCDGTSGTTAADVTLIVVGLVGD
jgi:hypothetical protein